MAKTESKQELENAIRAAIGWANPEHRVRDVKTLINQQIKTVLDELEKNVIVAQDSTKPHTGEFNEWYVPLSTIQKINERYKYPQEKTSDTAL